MAIGEDHVDGCALDFTAAPETTEEELERLLVPAGEEQDHEDDGEAES